MKNVLKLVYIVIFTSFLLASCEKDDSPKIVHGNIKLKVLVKHHDWPVHFMTVYLKSNATSWPGRDSTLYDNLAQTNQDGWCEFNNLYPGNYYVYASGYDPVVFTNVIGYAPVPITNAGLTNNTLAVTLYVSE